MEGAAEETRQLVETICVGKIKDARAKDYLQFAAPPCKGSCQSGSFLLSSCTRWKNSSNVMSYGEQENRRFQRSGAGSRNAKHCGVQSAPATVRMGFLPAWSKNSPEECIEPPSALMAKDRHKRKWA
jgi:hypothetical protein